MESKDQEADNCETCRGWCHLNCTETSKETTQILHKSFEWLCPNPTCQPNHHVGIQGTVKPTTNKFESLNITQAEAVTRRSKCKNNLTGKYNSKAKMKSKELQRDKKHNPKPSDAVEENTSDKGNLLKLPTKITTADYTGKEKCKERQKKTTSIKAKRYQDYPLLKQLTNITVKDHIGKVIGSIQKVISCDSCDRWTHLKCSDMTAKNYNKNKNTIFTWI